MKKLFFFIISMFSLGLYGQENLSISSVGVVEGRELPSCGKATIKTTYSNTSVDLVNLVAMDYDNSGHLTTLSAYVPDAFELATTNVYVKSESGEKYWKDYVVSGRTIRVEFLEDAIIPANDKIIITTVSEIKDDQDYTGILLGATIDHVLEDDVREDDVKVSSQAGAISTNTNIACAPLPVEIISFDAVANGGNVDLDWKTASEIDNSHFEVERSFDGVAFEQVGRVTGNGTSNEVNSYAFTDFNVGAPTAYYRLKQVDFNGDFEYSNVKQVIFKSKNTVSIYPNPFASKITIDTKGYEGVINITVTNPYGKIVKVVESAERQFDLSDLPKGAYLFTILDNENNLLFNNKVVKIQ